ncbi:phosphotransferase [Cohnella yongneupensis]|uniref:Phosphotransferase n=1 Tax=Cohnella yongneupensis TaxID=425006 RepID=A0ABW0QUY2_9BACL
MPYDNVLAQYWPQGGWTIAEGQSGWNNTTRYVDADGRKWVLRIYETHREGDKVRFEHAVLRALNGMSLPFSVPCPVDAVSGDTFVTTRDGSDRLACVFPYLVGERPPQGDVDTAFAIGEAAAQLSMALARLQDAVDLGEPNYPPYYELDKTHPMCTPERVANFCASPPEAFAGEAGRLRAIGQALAEMGAALPRLRELPHQLIHGDINHSNLLGHRNNITAVLDFEFCTRDVRAMEVAVIVAGLLLEVNDEEDQPCDNEEESDDVRLIASVLNGFGANLSLTYAEAKAIPLLARLRKLDVFLHFLGRYWDGVDEPQVLLTQLRSTATGLKRLIAIEDLLRTYCLDYLTTLNK